MTVEACSIILGVSVSSALELFRALGFSRCACPLQGSTSNEKRWLFVFHSSLAYISIGLLEAACLVN